MRSPEDVRDRWQKTFATATDLSALRTAVRSTEASPCQDGLRSVCWKAFLVFENLDRSTWPKTIHDSRSAYSSLRDHFLKTFPDTDSSASFDPLADVEGSPWKALRQDEMLRQEILQDVERCMPEHQFFREFSTQTLMTDILFIYCKLNADVSYRQGMHELLAPVLWVVWQDAVDVDEPLKNSSEPLIWSVLDSKFIEHDSFTLFCIIMQTAKSFYETGSTSQNPKTLAIIDSPIIARSQHMYDEYLQSVDVALLEHLTSIDILPQIFVLRWIRLLFGREFPFEHVLSLWDVLFAEDPTLNLVDLICVAMLLRIRWQLLDADYTSALTLLLRYPLPQPPYPPMTLVEDALYLRYHLSPDGGAHLIAKYTGKFPTVESTPNTDRKGRSFHTPKSSVDHMRRPRLRSPSRYLQEPGGLESIIQGAAKGVYQRTERLGLNQALRGAVQQLQAVNSSPRKYISAARRSLDGNEAAASDVKHTQERIQSLEIRNKALAKLVQAAIDDLSAQVRTFEEDKEESSANNLTLTIAKLQYIQVYLDDTGLPLVDEPSLVQSASPVPPPPPPKYDVLEDEETISWSPITPDKKGPNPIVHGNANPMPPFSSAAASIPESPTPKYTPSRRNPSSTQAASQSPSHTPVREATSPSSLRVATESSFQQPRPSLAQSSFSWMLGSEPDKAGFAFANTFASGHERKGSTDKKARAKAGFLFGDNSAQGPSMNRKQANDTKDREEDDGFTLGTLSGVAKHD